jgi:hypothetical protein
MGIFVLIWDTNKSTPRRNIFLIFAKLIFNFIKNKFLGLSTAIRSHLNLQCYKNTNRESRKATFKSFKGKTFQRKKEIEPFKYPQMPQMYQNNIFSSSTCDKQCKNLVVCAYFFAICKKKRSHCENRSQKNVAKRENSKQIDKFNKKQ